MVWAACISFELSFFNKAILNTAQSSLTNIYIVMFKIIVLEHITLLPSNMHPQMFYESKFHLKILGVRTLTYSMFCENS
jgi:hypothetical protein